MEFLNRKALCRCLFAFLAFASGLEAQTLKQIGTIDLPGHKGDSACRSHSLMCEPTNQEVSGESDR